MCLSHEDVLSCSWEVVIGYLIFLFESCGSLGSGPASAFVVWIGLPILLTYVCVCSSLVTYVI